MTVPDDTRYRAYSRQGKDPLITTYENVLVYPSTLEAEAFGVNTLGLPSNPQREWRLSPEVEMEKFLALPAEQQKTFFRKSIIYLDTYRVSFFCDELFKHAAVNAQNPPHSFSLDGFMLLEQHEVEFLAETYRAQRNEWDHKVGALQKHKQDEIGPLHEQRAHYYQRELQKAIVSINEKLDAHYGPQISAIEKRINDVIAKNFGPCPQVAPILHQKVQRPYTSSGIKRDFASIREELMRRKADQGSQQ